MASSVSRHGWRRALRNVLRVGPTSSERRLRGDIADLEAELNRRALKGDAAAQPDWSNAARSLLENAKAAINDGNLATGYANLLSAQREVIWSYGPTEIVAAQVSLREETGDDKITGWRARAINGLVAEIGSGHPQLLGQLAELSANAATLTAIDEILQNTDGADRTVEVANILRRSGTQDEAAASMASLLVQVCTGAPRVSTLVASFAGLRADPVADRALLYEAARIRDESHQNRYRKVERLQWQLMVLSLALLFVVAGIFILAATLPIQFSQTQGFGGRILAYVGLFGALGGCLSAIQSLSKGATVLRIPEQLAMGAITFVRPLFGAAAAMAVFAFLESGLLTVQQNTNAAVLATSFVAGFTERFVVHAAGSITKTGSVE